MRRWWWISRPRVGSDWSPEELRTQWLIHLIGMPLFAISCYAIVMSLFSMGLHPLLVVIVGVAPTYLASLYAAQLFAAWLWPDLVKTADANAERRIALEKIEGVG